MHERQLDETRVIPPPGPGFAGGTHEAALVVEPGRIDRTDPFFLMADDHVSAAGPFGGAHPHAGLETVSILLNGSIEDTSGRLETGDVEWMTAGRGIVHNEDMVVSAHMRLFQLWVILPERDRNMPPRVQMLRRGAMPLRREPGVEARVYSGRSGDTKASTLNATPVTLVDIRLDPAAAFAQELPASYNGFIVVLEGDARLGQAGPVLSNGSVGWTHPVAVDGDSRLSLSAGNSGARVLLFAGQPQRIPIVAHGPFIAGSREELADYYRGFQQGEFARMREIASSDAAYFDTSVSPAILP